MTFSHGKNLKIVVTSAASVLTDMSGDKNSVTLTLNRNNPETTTFGKVATQRIAGLQDATLSGAGIWNSDSASGIDAVFSGLLQDLGSSLIQLYPGGCSTCLLYQAYYQMAKYEIVSAATGPVVANWEFQISEGWMFTLQPYSLLAIGDSKTNFDEWVGYLVPLLGSQWSEYVPRQGYAGYTVANMYPKLREVYPTSIRSPQVIVFNLGANDVNALPAESTWKGNLRGCITHLRTVSPLSEIYIARAWRRGYATECDTLATWIADVVTEYASHVHLGMDERVWMEGGDDGATMTVDGIHYSAAGQTACAAAWLAVLT